MACEQAQACLTRKWDKLEYKILFVDKLKLDSFIGISSIGWHLLMASNETFRARLVWGSLSFHNLVLNFHNSNSKLITHNPNTTITQKIQYFWLVTKLNHVSQFLTQIFVKMMDPPTDTTYPTLLFGHKTHSCISIFISTFCQNDRPTHWHYIEDYGCCPRPFSFLLFKHSSTTTNNVKPRIHHHQPSSTTTNDKLRNPQLQPPPPTALNTTTTSTKKSEWIKNPNPPTTLNQNHNLHQKIWMNKKSKPTNNPQPKPQPPSKNPSEQAPPQPKPQTTTTTTKDPNQNP